MVNNVEKINEIVANGRQWLDIFYTRYLKRVGMGDRSNVKEYDLEIGSVKESKVMMDMLFEGRKEYAILENDVDRTKIYSKEGIEKIFFKFLGKEVRGMEDVYGKRLVNMEGKMDVPFIIVGDDIVVNELFDFSKWKEEEIVRGLMVIQFHYEHGFGLKLKKFKQARFKVDMLTIMVHFGFYDETDKVRKVKPRLGVSTKSKEYETVKEKLKLYGVIVRVFEDVNWTDQRNFTFYGLVKSEKEWKVNYRKVLEKDMVDTLYDEELGVEGIQYEYEEGEWHLRKDFMGVWENRTGVFKKFWLYVSEDDNKLVIDSKMGNRGEIKNLSTVQLLDGFFEY